MSPTQKIIEQAAGVIPFIGIALFTGLFFYSSTLYPGGSQASLHTVGFDWVNNYWCNLMNEHAMNGQFNPARPFSVVALMLLCLSLMVFFIQFALTFPKNRLWQKWIAVNGILSMAFALLIFTRYHDLMTILSSLFGLVVVIGIIREVYTSELTKYKISGMICILLLAANNGIYYTEYFIQALPLLQKVTFAVVLLWIAGLNFELIKKKKKALG